MAVMSNSPARTGELSAETSQQSMLLVWDLPTRLYHWLQAGLVTAALLTGFFAPESWLSIHIWIGYGLAVLILFRLVWGVFGSELSRFSSFIFPPHRVLEHVHGLVGGPRRETIGHNPLGALSVFAMIAIIAATLISGLIVLGGVENQGALKGFAGFSVGTTARHIHSILTFVLIGLVLLHLAGVWLESRMSGQSLVGAMITGKKRLPANPGREAASDWAIDGQRRARWPLALISLGAAGIAIAFAGVAADSYSASGFVAMPPLKIYNTECGTCHEAYHPSLLPRASWAGLIVHLDNHFGEDASLDPETAKAIAAYLDKYASEAWDTEAANLLRKVDPTDPSRMTATPFWRRKHSRIPTAIFKSSLVGSPANCQACHLDAASGRFDDQMIATPRS